MKRYVVLFFFNSLISLGQQTTAENILNAFDNVEKFKEKLFFDFPLKSDYIPEKIVLENYNYTIYKTQNENIPVVLIADKAISIGMHNDLYLKYYEDFYKYLNQYCYVTMKQSPSIGLYDEWDCEKCYWMIRPLSGGKSGVFFIKKKY